MIRLPRSESDTGSRNRSGQSVIGQKVASRSPEGGQSRVSGTEHPVPSTGNCLLVTQTGDSRLMTDCPLSASRCGESLGAGIGTCVHWPSPLLDDRLAKVRRPPDPDGQALDGDQWTGVADSSLPVGEVIDGSAGARQGSGRSDRATHRRSHDRQALGPQATRGHAPCGTPSNRFQTAEWRFFTSTTRP